jgi:two-component system OmpR family sensor kinase
MKSLLKPLLYLPAFIGLVIGLVLNLTPLVNPVLFLRADLGAVIFGLGLLVSGGLMIYSIVSNHYNGIIEENARKNAAERRRFLRLLDHELKNPLTAIMAGLVNLGSDTSANQQQATLTSVETQVQRLNQLVGDLRKLSDLETRPIEFHSVDIPALLQDVFEITQARVKGQRQFNLLIPQTPWPLPEILGDQDLLFLAIHNLLDNAVKFTQPGDSIELRSSEDGHIVLIEIADSGPGIPEDELELVWGELFRGKSARGIPGSGIGLALVQAIVRRHQGSVSVRSRRGSGTVVSIRLPLIPVTNP